MAAALLERAGGGRIEVRSAGSAPADDLNPVVVDAMAEVGVDLGGRVPRAIDPDEVEASDVVITMGCGDSCPVFPGVRYLDWELDDPSGASIEDVRRIRDEIDRRVTELARDLLT
jgi:arsenate reductase